MIPFCTNGGGGLGNIEKNIAKECAKSVILPGLGVNGIVSEDVAVWLEAIGYK